MPTIIVASQNPVKIRSARIGFERMFPDEVWEVRGVDAASGVAHQPMSSEETLQGATNRARAARQAEPSADFAVGMEGGVEMKDGQMECCAWIVIEGKDGKNGRARTGMFFLPPAIVALVQQGMELGHADDQLFGRENSKHANGTVGILTGDVIDRTEYYAHAVCLALVPFKNADLYF